MKKIICASILLALSLPVHAAFTKADRGTSGAKLLKLFPGARAVGMGEAYVGLADDVLAALWNPAGLTRIARPQIMAMRNLWLSGMKNDTVVCAVPLGRYGQSLALSVQQFNMGGIDIYSEGELVKTFKPRDTALGISYARMIGLLRLGVNVKSIHQQFIDETVRGYALDLGCMFRNTQDTTGIGLSVSNMGPDIDGDPLPLGIRAGVMHKFFKMRNLIITLDGYMPRDDMGSMHAGAEYQIDLSQRFKTSMRCGYKTKNISDLDMLAGLSAGLGLEWNDVRLDYVFVPYGELGNTHRMNIGYVFGGKHELRYKAERDYQKSMSMYNRGILLDASNTLRPYEDNPALHQQASKLASVINEEIEQAINPERMYTQAYLFYKRRNFHQAKELLTEALKIEPDHAKAKKLMTRVRQYLLAASREEKKKIELEQKLLEEKTIKTLLWRAYRQYRQGMYTEAVQTYEQILELQPDNTTALQGIEAVKGDIERQKKKKKTNTSVSSKDSEKLDLQQADKLYHLGLKEYLEGNVQKASALWEKALHYNSNHQQTKNALLDANLE
ncbi:MAG: PorV/PorQ family protein [bacterium]